MTVHRAGIGATALLIASLGCSAEHANSDATESTGGAATGGVNSEPCSAGRQLCASVCVDVMSDRTNCGACGTTCSTLKSCVAGACQCQSGLVACGGDCVDVRANAAHCGTCDNACPAGESCSDGACTGGSSTGGSSTGGGSTGGGSTGGAGTGGVPAGGADTGGVPSGGTPTGGSSTGGAATGGAAGAPPIGGSATGGSSTGGESTGGVSHTSVPFILGADVSNTQQSSSTYVDTDGQTKSIFALLKNHGFNYIRLKTFVDPSAPYGYASSANGCSGLSEPFGDKAHVIAYGQQVKAEGLGFLLDFHYSDVWADPGNQIIPDPWRDATSIEQLASYVRDYTEDVISSAIAAGARPDMVQVGNEITPGMLMHVPGANTDCWGNDPDPAPVGGSTSNWDNLATLLDAGIEAVRSVDPAIEIVLHIENLSAASWWVQSALDRGVDFDILGISCYTPFQGQPSVWEATFSDLAANHPNLDFIIAEYNPNRTEANLIMKNLPNGQGRGTFFWEPTASGDWGQAMFTWQGNSAIANASDFAEYDALLPQLGL